MIAHAAVIPLIGDDKDSLKLTLNASEHGAWWHTELTDQDGTRPYCHGTLEVDEIFTEKRPAPVLYISDIDEAIHLTVERGLYLRTVVGLLVCGILTCHDDASRDELRSSLIDFGELFMDDEEIEEFILTPLRSAHKLAIEG
jgi:hypothetical protein